MNGPSKLWLAALCFALPVPAIAQEEASAIDRILAVVDEDPILQSEVDQVIGLGLVDQLSEEADEE